MKDLNDFGLPPAADGDRPQGARFYVFCITSATQLSRFAQNDCHTCNTGQVLSSQIVKRISISCLNHDLHLFEFQSLKSGWPSGSSTKKMRAPEGALIGSRIDRT